MQYRNDKMDSVKYLPVQDGQPTYFQFEEDFVEENIRCIPMIVRFKLDACGIKLKLAEWSRFDKNEREQLSRMVCTTEKEIIAYRSFLQKLITAKTSQPATDCTVEKIPAWANVDQILLALQEKATEFGWMINLSQWRNLNNLQRFALLKLCRPGHENKNFPVAMREFGLVDQE